MAASLARSNDRQNEYVQTICPCRHAASVQNTRGGIGRARWLLQNGIGPILPFKPMRGFDIKDGLIHIPDVPGIGLEWNEDAVTANRADI
jgi:L-alanine-DL-glutamate epimerase-like enolase superfamily enzyme